MAILKYTTADGQTVKVNSYKVNNLIPQQSKGDNPNAVMSQKAVTDEMNEIGLQIDEVTGKITAVKTTADKAASDITALTQTVNGKVNKSDVYTKTESDNKYLTAADITGKAEKSEVNAVKTTSDKNAADIQTINTDLTEIHNTLGDVATTDDLGELENVVSTKANKSALEAEIERAKGAEKTNADNITALTTTVGTKAASADLTAEVNRAKASEKENADRIEALENIRVLDCGTY